MRARPVSIEESSPFPSSPELGMGSSENGILVVDKPEGMTSFAVVAEVRKRFKFKKVGHCGTLDPFATGVLVLCTNQATRIADQLTGQDKQYQFTLFLGIETDTLDKTGEVVGTYSGPLKTEEEIREALDRFRGTYLQRVPRYAAVKVQGRRLYDWTRRGIDVELPQREVHIYRLDLVAYQWPEARLEVHCSKGTYVRQLAYDLGRMLGCGAHVSQLRRSVSGLFRIEQAFSLNELREMRSGGSLREKLISLNDALSHLPSLSVTEEEAVKRLHNGYLDPLWEAEHQADFPAWKDPVRLVTKDGRLLALWWPRPHRTETEETSPDSSQEGSVRRLRVFH